MFNLMHSSINQEALSLLFNAEIVGPIEQEYDFDSYYTGSANHDEFGQFDMLSPEEQQMMMEQQAAQGGMMPGASSGPRRQIKNDVKVGRNDLCPCGSGKKFKFCHGK